jgi:hypothetical protein
MKRIQPSWVLVGLLATAIVLLIHRPATVYSSSPTVFPTGIEVDESVNAQGSGLKHKRAGSCTPSFMDSCEVTITWPGIAFADTNYTVVCTPDNYIGRGTETGVFSIISKTTTSIAVGFKSSSPTDSFTGIECMAMHD